MRPIKLLLPALFFTSCMLTTQAQSPALEGRAMWFWQSPKSPYGSMSVVGHPDREDAAITRLKSWRVTMLYGSYPRSTDRAELRTWNSKLAANGIVSFLLLSDTAYLSPSDYPTLDARIAADFITFNQEAAKNERFAGLAFDIEPHILPAWKTEDPLARRAHLADLLHLYQHVREHLGNAQLEATLPASFSHLTGGIRWDSAADRDQYFTALASVCDRVSIMAFEQNSGAKSYDRSSEELELLHGRGRLALRANLGHEWLTLDDFWRAATDAERLTHTPIDIQDFDILASDEDTAHGSKP